jgi:hypothetical protein
MKEVTLSLDDEVAAAGERYARAQHQTLAHLVNQLLAGVAQGASRGSLVQTFHRADALKSATEAAGWTRQELHDRQAVH